MVEHRDACSPANASEIFAQATLQLGDADRVSHGHVGFISGHISLAEIFGWDKMIGLVRKLRHRGRETVGWVFTFTNAVYNLVPLRTLIAAEAGA
jgi:hypothetical protein